MNRCVIIPAWAPDGVREIVSLTDDDYVICADGGYDLALREGILPHMLVGDFDSLDVENLTLPHAIKVVRTPKEKDETDTLLCLQRGMALGFVDFVIAGGIGGRLDHTLANLQLLAYGAHNGIHVWLMDRNNRVTMLMPGQIMVPRQDGYKLSVFSYWEKCEGVTLEKVKYPLQEAVLESDYPLGVSNEFISDTAVVRFSKGRLLLVLSRDGDH